MQLLVIFILGAAVFWYWNRSGWHSSGWHPSGWSPGGGLSADERRRRFWRIAMAAGGLLLVVLVATGRLHIFAALAAILLALLRRLPMLIKLWPIWRKLRESLASSQSASPGSGRQGAQRKPYQGEMSIKEARDILGVDPMAGERDIVQAHRRLMQKVHPDRGGNDVLAARANEAKARLLADLA